MRLPRATKRSTPGVEESARQHLPARARDLDQSRYNSSGVERATRQRYCGDALLGVGPQCSAAQLQLVRAWFKASIPKMSGSDPELYKNIQRPGSLEEICYNSPDSASIQETWARIRVTQDGAQVLIDAVGNYLDRDESGHFHYKATYKIEDHSITTLSHEEVPLKGKSQKEE